MRRKEPVPGTGGGGSWHGSSRSRVSVGGSFLELYILHVYGNAAAEFWQDHASRNGRPLLRVQLHIETTLPRYGVDTS